MQFDIRTLVVAVALTNVFCAGARVLLWRMHPTIPGLGRWALAGGAGAVALFMLLSYGINHWSPSLSISQLFVVLGLVLAWDGFRRFIGKAPLSPQILSIILVTLVAWIVTTHLQDSMKLRALGNAILIVILSALIARDLLTARKPIPLGMRATGFFYAINSAVFLIRAIATDPSAVQVGPMNPEGFAVFLLLWWLCMTIAITLGMVLMTSERLQANLDNQANRDPLTGALNRRAFSVIAEKEIARSIRYETPLSLLMMDLDKFKHINDQFGHDAGDALLCQFVTIASQVMRDEDVFCRYGGEEFVALLPNASAELALVVAERLRTALATESTAKNSEFILPVTVSIGVAERGKEEGIESLLLRSDVALYIAKRNGRNCCEIAKGIEETSTNANTEQQVHA